MSDRTNEDRFPGYDVLAKRFGESWNALTREVIDDRLAVPREPRFFTAEEWAVLAKLCGRILPQPADRPAIPLPAYIDWKMLTMGETGTRIEPMPWDGEAWKRGLKLIDAEAQRRYGESFAALKNELADAILNDMQHGKVAEEPWGDIPPQLFFKKRILPDIIAAYYAHPTAWNELGFGGPASPRGYVRLEGDKRDPWEAAEAHPGSEAKARRQNARVR